MTEPGPGSRTSRPSAERPDAAYIRAASPGSGSGSGGQLPPSSSAVPSVPTDAPELVDPSPASTSPPVGPAAVIVLGRHGVEREAVEILLRSAGLDVVDLVRLESRSTGSAPPLVVTVLVEPDGDDWRRAHLLDARVVVVLDSPPSDERTVQLLVSGADAVLHAGVEVERLVAAVRVVGLGQAFLGTAQARVVIDRLRSGDSGGQTAPALTPRETEILRFIARGESVRETAIALGVSLKTVQNLQSRLFRKLGARNQAQAIGRAYELGLVEGSLP